MTDRDDRSLQRETGQERPTGDAQGEDLIGSRHGRHGGSEESEGAPQAPPRDGQSHLQPHDRAEPSGDRDAR